MDFVDDLMMDERYKLKDYIFSKAKIGVNASHSIYSLISSKVVICGTNW